MTSLDVRWDHQIVGVLTTSPTAQLRFSYSEEWLNHPDALPLSRSLPLQSGPQQESSVFSFFSGLLPEEGIRKQVAANLGISESNDFALLNKLGGDCAGAIRIVKPDEDDTSPEKQKECTPGELLKRIRKLPRNPLLAGEKGIRLSLAGAQSKLPIILNEYRWYLSDANNPSTHILKPEPEAYPGLVAVEAFCLNLAGTVGIPSVISQELDMEGLPVLCVKRYDREENSQGGIDRIHQEDLCQSLSRPPQRKYQQEGGPSALDMMNCIREWSSIPVLDLQQAIDMLVFNLVIGNADAHGKNFSWLYHNRTRRLAPAYDLISTTLWSELSPRMAMRIGQAKFINEVTLNHLLLFGKQAGFSLPPFKKRIQNLLDRLSDHLEHVLENHPRLQPNHRETLNRDILKRIQNISIH